jgi:molybdopterin-guanine dinucleotide biosynthesis protein
MSTFGNFQMDRTSIKVTTDTHKTVIQTRGYFEQLFKRNLSLDDTIYLSARLISIIFREGQKLLALNRITVQEDEKGVIQVEGLDKNVLMEILPTLIEEFTEIDKKLSEKEKTPQPDVTEQCEET